MWGVQQKCTYLAQVHLKHEKSKYGGVGRREELSCGFFSLNTVANKYVAVHAKTFALDRRQQKTFHKYRVKREEEWQNNHSNNNSKYNTNHQHKDPNLFTSSLGAEFGKHTKSLFFFAYC